MSDLADYLADHYGTCDRGADCYHGRAAPGVFDGCLRTGWRGRACDHWAPGRSYDLGGASSHRRCQKQVADHYRLIGRFFRQSAMWSLPNRQIANANKAAIYSGRFISHDKTAHAREATKPENQRKLTTGCVPPFEWLFATI